MEYGFAFFPGQGAQAPGMGRDLYENSQAARLVFEEASDGAGLDVAKLCFDSDKEALSRTENSQIAIFTHSMAALAALQEAGVSFKAAAGFSLGEYTALAAAGVRDFTVAIGTVGVLNALVRSACDDDAWRDQVLRAFHKSDMVAVDALSCVDGVKPTYGKAIAQLARIRGGAEAFEACRAICEPLGCVDGLDELEKTYELVVANTRSGKLIVDFSIVSSFDYYTGLVFKAYAPQVPASLASGGRYDTTLVAFGRNEPAAGFAIGLERVLAAIEAQGATPPDTRAHETLHGNDPYELFAQAARLREQGIRVELGGE